jgi:uncharacterized protein YecA (UPF0149 family)
MEKQKTGRNAPCPCGSKKKYKNCCLPKSGIDKKSIQLSSLDQEIHEAAILSLNENERDIVNSIEKLKNFLELSNLSISQKLNVQLLLAQAYQSRGEHIQAIDTLKLITIDTEQRQDQMILHINHCAANSYGALGFYQISCDIFDDVLKELEVVGMDPKLRAGILLDAGKAFFRNYNDGKAQECWEKTIQFYEGREDDNESYIRIKSNLGFLLLRNPDERKQEEGVKIIEECSIFKERSGDIQGLTTNFSQLGRYFWKKKRYERAIAYTRMDLHLSRKIGNVREIASSLYNLAEIYIELKQLSSARKQLKEAKQIGEIIQDRSLIIFVDELYHRATEIGKDAYQKGEKIGPKAFCGCGSKKEYQVCCGQADFEPIDNPLTFTGISKDVTQSIEEMKNAGVEPSRLDYILRQSDEAKARMGWIRVEGRDGWIKISELPDMANYHMSAARILAEEAQTEDKDSTAKPLSCVILSVCALEAFINHVSYSLFEMRAFPESKLHSIPSEIARDVMEFQRRTELTQKWAILGTALCGDGWPPPDTLWNNFKNLIYVRNELVHFKSGEYEQVDLMPKEPHDVMKHVPSNVETRKIPSSWPGRLLTAAYASHCVVVAESMIQYFKTSYREARISTV